MRHSIFLMNPIGSVEKTWGSFLNEAYLRRTYLQGQMLNEGFSRKRLRERLQSFAGAVANVCGNGCNALRLRWAKMAPESPVLFWIREKTAP